MDEIEALQNEYAERLLAEIQHVRDPAARIQRIKLAMEGDRRIDARLAAVHRQAVREMLEHMTPAEVAKQLSITTARVGQLAGG